MTGALLHLGPNRHLGHSGIGAAEDPIELPYARDLASGPLEQGGITGKDNNVLMRGLMTHQGPLH